MVTRGLKRLILPLILGVSLLVSSCTNQVNTGPTPDNDAIVQSNAQSGDLSPIETDSESTPIRPAFTSAFSSDDSIYFIMVDRFNDSDPDNNLSDVDKNDLLKFQGGDIKGITQKLDYIQSMGFTTIWLTPIMTNGKDGYHGYWIDDYESVDPHFGTMDDLKELVTSAHEKDMKVILDYIVNHTGYDSPWLNDPEKEDWFHEEVNITNWTDQEQVENGWLSGLPDLNQDNPEVTDYFVNNALWWIDQTGIDGFRLDTVKHVPKSFWESFTSQIKAQYPDFYFLGEVWSENPRYLELYHQTGIDGLTNYSLYNGISNAFNSLSDMNSLKNAINQEKFYSNPDLNGIFIDNHDNPRLVSTNGEWGQAYLKQALTFLYSYPAIPVIYYGTEIAMTGGADPENRHFMAWDETDNNAILTYVKTLNRLREDYKGIFTILQSDKKTLVYSLSKTETDDKLLVVMNSDRSDQDIVLSQALLGGTTELVNYLDASETLKPSDGNFTISLGPVDLAIYKILEH